MADQKFQDHFSKQSEGYQKFRPKYPSSLFKFLADLTPTKYKAWDCGTGSGQSAQGLAPYFDRIFATDASQQQIKNARTHDKISYSVASAEKSGLESLSIDLITIAQALHWFQFDLFYDEVNRVLKERAVIATWTYNRLVVSPEINEIVNDFYHHIIYSYWPKERRHVESEYKDIPFPFEIIEAPQFQMRRNWSLDHLIGYIGTWSAVRKYKEKKGEDPLKLIEDKLNLVWGAKEKPRRVTWPLTVKIGRRI